MCCAAYAVLLAGLERRSRCDRHLCQKSQPNCRSAAMQVVRVLPELRPTMQFLWDNRRLWNERYLVELANDRAKAPADKDAERARALS